MPTERDVLVPQFSSDLRFEKCQHCEAHDMRHQRRGDYRTRRKRIY